MEPDSPCGDSAQFTQYDKLVAQYRAVVVQCQACLDQLAATERELRLVASQMDGHAPDVDGEINAAQSKLLGNEPKGLLWGISQLSKREREVFEMIGQGLATLEIAEKLQLNKSTVETYRERLKKKLNLMNGHALVRHAVLWSISRDNAAS